MVCREEFVMHRDFPKVSKARSSSPTLDLAHHAQALANGDCDGWVLLEIHCREHRVAVLG